MNEQKEVRNNVTTQQQGEKDYKKMYHEVLNEKYDLLSKIDSLEKFIKSQAEYIAKSK